MLHVVKKHCPEEARLNRWAKRRLTNKNNRQKIEFICLFLNLVTNATQQLQ